MSGVFKVDTVGCGRVNRDKYRNIADHEAESAESTSKPNMMALQPQPKQRIAV